MSARKREEITLTGTDAVEHLRDRIAKLDQTYYSHNWSRWTFKDYLAVKLLLEKTS